MIQVKISKLAMADPAQLRRLQNPLAVAKVMAEAMEARMRSGQTATPAEPYSTREPDGRKKKRRYSISKPYADRLGLPKQTFRSSADMHAQAGIKTGTYRVTGGMWDGLQVRNFGEGAVIEFAGVSLGAQSAPAARKYRTGKVLDVTERETRRRKEAAAAGRTVRRDRDVFEAGGKIMRHERKTRKDASGNVIMQKHPQLVRNWMKAGVVFKHSRVNVLQPTDTETRDLIDGFGAAMFDATAIVVVGMQASTMHTPTALAERFRRALHT